MGLCRDYDLYVHTAQVRSAALIHFTLISFGKILVISRPNVIQRKEQRSGWYLQSISTAEVDSTYDFAYRKIYFAIIVFPCVDQLFIC